MANKHDGAPEASVDRMEERPLRVLTIDGGGMRGIYTAAFLDGLAQLFQRKRGCGRLDIGSAFDLIVGTSTGAIIGCAAAIDKPMSEVVALYRENGPKIFSQKLKDGFAILGQIPSRSAHLHAGAEALQAALMAVLGTQTFGDVYRKRRIALAIPTVEMGHQRAWVFKTSHLGGHRDEDTSLVDACMATSAAPIYRSLAAIDANDGLDGHRVFADGGLWANNPVLVGLLDALQMHPSRSIEVFSAGTCPRPEGETIKKSDLDRGLIGWKFGGAAAQLSIAAQEFAFDNMARLFAKQLTELGRNAVTVRFPKGDLRPSLLPHLDIDCTSDAAMDALIAQARDDVLIAKSASDDPSDVDGRRIQALFESMPESQVQEA